MSTNMLVMCYRSMGRAWQEYGYFRFLAFEWILNVSWTPRGYCSVKSPEFFKNIVSGNILLGAVANPLFAEMAAKAGLLKDNARAKPTLSMGYDAPLQTVLNSPYQKSGNCWFYLIQNAFDFWLSHINPLCGFCECDMIKADLVSR